MNATDDGYEPIGEAPELTMPRVASLVDRQTAAFKEIRALCAISPFDVLQVEYDWGVVDTPVVTVADITAILERNGL